MSHNLIMTVAEKQREGRPLFIHEQALKAALEAQGIKVVKDNRRFGGRARRDVWVVEFPRREEDGDNHWVNPLLIDVETGQDQFDNYSQYLPSHIEVREGRKRVGEDGRWGRVERVWELDTEYLRQATNLAAEACVLEAKKRDEQVTKREVSDDGLTQQLWIGCPNNANKEVALL